MTFTIPRGPQRIVCLTEEPTEWLYLLGEQHRIVGITAYTVRPSEAQRDKPVVSAFIGGSIARIKALQPDLIIGFSDVQAEYARSLIAEGLPVLIFNQRSVQEILEVLGTLGNLVGAEARASQLLEGYVRRIEEVANEAAKRTHRPRVYFEEWDEPMISSIRWVHELIEIAGGDNVFAEEAQSAASKGRIVTVERVRERAPEVILASWCGKAFDRESLVARLGEAVPAIRNGRVYEVPSEIILQPGPACLTDGLDALVRLIHSP
jgi:iron complex transport system substrate-binding protein